MFIADFCTRSGPNVAPVVGLGDWRSKMLIIRIVLLASVALGAHVASAAISASVPRHHAAHHGYDGNVNVHYSFGRAVGSDTAVVYAGTTVRCIWRKGCS